MRKQLYIVSRARPELYQQFRARFAGRDDVEVLLDRRHGERRKRTPADPGRRLRDVTGELESRGWIVVEVGRREARSVVTAVLEAATMVTDVVLGGRRPVIERFPYVIERGDDRWGSALVRDDRLALPDREPFQVSRRHCVVVKDARELAVVDTMSRLGTLVNGVLIGAGTGRRRAPLRSGENHIAVGGPRARYAFRIVLDSAPA
ncbi:MAG: FHA domain-containing protein [Candidatus Rokuibacteriota bacterium]